MLKYDGAVDYYLNDNDLTKKADNTASDVANTSYGGNAMMEWGQDGYRVHWKLVPDNDEKGFTFIVGNTNALSLTPWNHYDCQNNVNRHFYMAIFFGSYINDKLRSISGGTNATNEDRSTEISKARANNATANVIWDTEVYADWFLLEMLCVLISKSLDSQTKFGSGVSKESTPIGQGTMNDKGLFYGRSDQTSGVKVFGIENFWGNLFHAIRGLIVSGGNIKAKITHGTQDGSTASDYNTDGTGYITVGTIDTGKSGYINAMLITAFGLFPNKSNGSSSTYYCDGVWYGSLTTSTYYALIGGDKSREEKDGAFCYDLADLATYSGGSVGACISCKPLA
jgi:hypothetical protein